MSAVPAPEDAPQSPLEVAEADIDAVLYEAKGDPREAIRMLLADLATMALVTPEDAEKVFGRFGSAGLRTVTF